MESDLSLNLAEFIKIVKKIIELNSNHNFKNHRNRNKYKYCYYYKSLYKTGFKINSIFNLPQYFRWREKHKKHELIKQLESMQKYLQNDINSKKIIANTLELNQQYFLTELQTSYAIMANILKQYRLTQRETFLKQLLCIIARLKKLRKLHKFINNDEEFLQNEEEEEEEEDEKNEIKHAKEVGKNYNIHNLTHEKLSSYTSNPNHTNHANFNKHWIHISPTRKYIH